MEMEITEAVLQAFLVVSDSPVVRLAPLASSVTGGALRSVTPLAPELAS